MMEPMAGNAEQFKQSFREEAREILTDLEAALLELNENRGDAELVGRIFRGLHTIKGSGSMFGFERMAAFTHDLETAFDMVRDGRLAISSELIDLTLAALDQISAMLEEDVGGAHADAAACDGILKNVRRLAGTGGTTASQRIKEPKPDGPAAPCGPVKSWKIRFAPGPDLMRYGANPLLLLRELGSLGGLSLRASLEAVPPLAELDPERCYVAWEMVLATAADQDTIRDVFIFVEDTCALSIQPDEEIAAQDAAPGIACDAESTGRGLEEKRSRTAGRRAYDKPDNASSLRVPAAKLDQFVNLVGELVTVQARLSEISGRLEDAEVASVAEEVERLTSALRESSMNIRMMPIRGTFEKFRRLVHDLARELGKQVELSVEGADTELDKTVIEQLGDPLMHLIRNSMDHGIEPAAERVAQGKPPGANIHLSARHSGASVLISVADDGRGIDAQAVRARAVERGLMAADAELSEAEIFTLIFQPGFSTARQVTDVSGRGVGMDVVRQRVESLRGTVDVASRTGSGTTVTMRLPLTLAIIDGLLIGVDDACFVLPMASTLECIELTRQDIARANGKHLAVVRGELVPYIRLREHFSLDSQPPEIEQVMLVETSQGRVGIVVDRVLGNCQTVIKSLSRMYRHVQFVSGATILGNGTVALILDPERLVQDAVRQTRHDPRQQTAVQNSRRKDAVMHAGIATATN
jgi:two-component system, chemotaxis family, sensor kinase CheA